MIKKIKTLALVGVLSVGVVGCSNNSPKEDSVKISLVLSTGGVNDASFNQSAWEGALEAKNEYGVEVSYLESNSDADFMQNIETAIDQESDLVVGVGFQIGTAIEEASKSYPNQQFAIIDSTYEEIPSNVRPILFDEEQAGYLTGLIAGKTTETDVIGFVPGMDIISCTSFGDGFERGAKEVNPNVKVLKQFVNSFTDSAKAKVIAQQMINSENADIIFTACGTGNSGVLEAVKEANIKAIGVDMPSSYLAPGYILTSALKNVGEGLKLTIKDFIDGNFNGGSEVKYNLLNGGVGYEKTDLIPKDVIEFVEGKINSK